LGSDGLKTHESLSSFDHVMGKLCSRLSLFLNSKELYLDAAGIAMAFSPLKNGERQLLALM
jgi:hypothetical protein